MTQAREASLWLAMLWGGSIPRKQAKEIIRRWLDAGHMRLGDLAQDVDGACAELELDSHLRQLLQQGLAAAPQASQQLALLADHGVDLVTRADIAYPGVLAERLGESAVPYAMFLAGDLGVLSDSFVALVGAQVPEQDASDLSSELAQAIAGAGYHLVGGYAPGVDRLTMDAAQDQGLGNVLVLPCGIEPFVATLDRWQLPDEGGSRLVLSPFEPGAQPSEALGAAREKLVVGLADAVVLVAPDAGPAQTTWWRIAKTWGIRVLVWSGSDANTARAWLEEGAQIFDNGADLRSSLAGEEQSASKWPSDADLAVEPLEPFEDADQAIAALGSMGRVPDVLAQRLRDGEFYQHDPDPWLAEDEDEIEPTEPRG